MPLKKPNSEDVIKINSEINQIVNQRFVITTTAITVFGVMIAWMFPKSAPNPGDSIGSGTFLLSGLLSVGRRFKSEVQQGSIDGMAE